MTYREAAQMAIDVQDAVNLSGVVHSFAEVTSAIWDEARTQGKGTDYVNTHPIVSLFLDKLVSLNGPGFYQSDAFSKAWQAVKEIAAGEESNV